MWDCDLTLDEFRSRLSDPDRSVHDYWLGTLLRQAKPDDAIALAGREAILEALPRLKGRLGRAEAFWTWLGDRWTRRG